MTASEKIESSALAIETNLSSASQIPLSLISRYCWRELPVALSQMSVDNTSSNRIEIFLRRITRSYCEKVS
jgi:hypothetical protein